MGGRSALYPSSPVSPAGPELQLFKQKFRVSNNYMINVKSTTVAQKFPEATLLVILPKLMNHLGK